MTTRGLTTTCREPAVAEPPQTIAPALGPSWRMPHWGSPAVVGIVALGFAVAIVAGWRYVVSSDEVAEANDWDQLVGLIDRVGGILLFVLGALFGVAVQARQTAEMKVAVDKNRAEAERQHQAALVNAQTARHNIRAAQSQADLVDDLARVLRDIREVVNTRRWDDSLFVQGRGLRLEGRKIAGRVRMLDEITQDGVLEDAEASPIDPRVDALAEQFDRALDRSADQRLQVI